MLVAKHWFFSFHCWISSAVFSSFVPYLRQFFLYVRTSKEGHLHFVAELQPFERMSQSSNLFRTRERQFLLFVSPEHIESSGVIRITRRKKVAFRGYLRRSSSAKNEFSTRGRPTSFLPHDAKNSAIRLIVIELFNLCRELRSIDPNYPTWGDSDHCGRNGCSVFSPSSSKATLLPIEIKNIPIDSLKSLLWDLEVTRTSVDLWWYSELDGEAPCVLRKSMAGKSDYASYFTWGNPDRSSQIYWGDLAKPLASLLYYLEHLSR